MPASGTVGSRTLISGWLFLILVGRGFAPMKDSMSRAWKGYVLAVAVTAGAALLRWALPEALGPTPFLAFYLAWVGAAVFGGLGPGLLATAASWLCLELLFNYTPAQIIFSDPTELIRFVILMAGGLAVSLVGGGLRRGRIRQRQQMQTLADLTQLTGLGQLLIRDNQDRIVHWSEGCARLYGFTAEQAIGRVSHELLRTEFSQPMETIRAKLHETGRWEGELTHHRADETAVHVASLWVLRNGTANPVVLEVNNDITDRKQAEEALRRSEEQFHRLFEDDLTGNFISTAEGQILLCNPAFATIFGFSRSQEAVGTSIVDLYLDPRERQPLVERLKKEGRIERLEVWRKRRDGEPIHIVENLVGHFNEQGQLHEIKGYLLEDTERKREQEALRESEQRLALVLSGTRVGMCYRDIATGEIRCTEQFARLWGLRTTTTTTMTTTTLSQVYHYQDWAERVHPEDMPRVETEQHRCLSERVPCEVEYRIVWPDGSVHWIAERGVYQYDPDGRPTHLLGIFLDITERREGEEAIRESEERFRILADANPLIIWVTDPTGRMQFVNRAYCEFFGTTLEKLQSEGWQPLIHPDDAPAYTEPYFECLRAHKPYHAQARVRRYDGQWRWIESYGQPRFSASGEFLGIAGSSPDITERKQAEEALRELTSTLESKVAQRTAELLHRTRQLQKLTLELSETEDRERQRMAEILHDDLQQVLAAAKFQLSLMRSRAKNDSSLQATAAQVDQMLKDAIDKSRSLSHELSPPVLQHGDLGETLRWLASQMQAKHGLTVDVRANGGVHLCSDAIKALLYKTAQELLFNAAKHAHVNQAKVQVRQHGQCVCLVVSDRGRGFDPQELRNAAGFGLLNIRERVELLGGRMKIRSAEGKGSVFFIVVPADETIGTDSEVETRPSARAPRAKRAAREDRGRVRVLLADDHEIVRQGLISMLSEEHTVEVVGEAANGREAVTLADQLRPDVVIMDVSMPIMNGEEATRQIKKDLPETRIVSLSMWEEPEVRERMYQAGAESYVLKTSPTEELLAAIRGRSTSGR